MFDVEVYFDASCVLDGVSISIPAGQIVGLVGPNGAGKSTLLNAVSGLAPLRRGRILVGQLEIQGMRPHMVTYRGVGRTFQGAQLIPELSVLDNVLLGRHKLMRRNAVSAALGLGARSEARMHVEKAYEVLKRIGILKLRYRQASELSYGEQKLVELARALASEPSVLLLDEIAAGVSPRIKEQLQELLRPLSSELKLTQLVVEHDMRFLTAITDSFIAMDAGQVIHSGSAAEVLAAPQVRASIGGLASDYSDIAEEGSYGSRVTEAP
jgi:ABC-type branched-subunit amino acid transport system ATPase component